MGGSIEMRAYRAGTGHKKIHLQGCIHFNGIGNNNHMGIVLWF